MKLEFDVKITAADLYDFMLYHTYHGFSGLLGTVSGALFLVAFGMSGQIMYLLAGGLLLFYIPCSLYIRSKRQVLSSEFFRNPFHYSLTEEGIQVSQGENEVSLSWGDVYKSTASNRNIYIYTSKVNAWIFPKRILGEQKSDLIQMISQHVDPSKVKIRQ